MNKWFKWTKEDTTGLIVVLAIIIGVLLVVFISGCKENKLNENSAIDLLMDSGCVLDNPYENEDMYWKSCINYEGDWLILKGEGCLGDCRVNLKTKEINISPVYCANLLVEDECETNKDCEHYKTICAIRYVCEQEHKFCVPYYMKTM